MDIRNKCKIRRRKKKINDRIVCNQSRRRTILNTNPNGQEFAALLYKMQWKCNVANDLEKKKIRQEGKKERKKRN